MINKTTLEVKKPNKDRFKPKYLNHGSFFLTTQSNKIVSEQTIDEISFAEGLRIQAFNINFR